MGFSQSVTFVATDTKLRSNEMTREYYIEVNKHMSKEQLSGILYDTITKYEAQLKAKESDLERQDMIIKCLNIDLDNKEKLLKAKNEEIERHFGLIKSLWKIIDDIDTYGDMAKSNDAMFRSLVENKQKERWELPITTDGYKLIYKESK